jgi:hypothetical protein
LYLSIYQHALSACSSIYHFQNNSFSNLQISVFCRNKNALIHGKAAIQSLIKRQSKAKA